MNVINFLVLFFIILTAHILLTGCKESGTEPEETKEIDYNKEIIAFTTFRTDPELNEDICIKNTDGSAEKYLTSSTNHDQSTVYSPDGEKIIYASLTQDGRESYLYIMNKDGVNKTRLTNNSSIEWNVPPDFSPDGSKIIYSLSTDIWVMNSDGSELSRLTEGSGWNKYAIFSPDGSKIAFQSSRDGNYEIYIMNIDGSEQQNLTNNPNYDVLPVFSPDGTQIVYISDRDGNFEIYKMNIDGTEQTNLTNDTGNEHGYYWNHYPRPVFTPDGSKIVYESQREGLNWEIYITNTDGSQLSQLTNNLEGNRSPAISPDGLKIAFISYRDIKSEIYIMNLDGSEQTRLTNNDVSDWGPVFRP